MVISAAPSTTYTPLSHSAASVAHLCFIHPFIQCAHAAGSTPLSHSAASRVVQLTVVVWVTQCCVKEPYSNLPLHHLTPSSRLGVLFSRHQKSGYSTTGYFESKRLHLKNSLVYRCKLCCLTIVIVLNVYYISMLNMYFICININICSRQRQYVI